MIDSWWNGLKSPDEIRPWGEYEVLLDASDVKVKRIRVQTGRYFGEDDIVRIEDDYNRE